MRLQLETPGVVSSTPRTQAALTPGSGLSVNVEHAGGVTRGRSPTGGRGTSPRASGGVHALVEAAGLPEGSRGGGHTRPEK